MLLHYLGKQKAENCVFSLKRTLNVVLRANSDGRARVTRGDFLEIGRFAPFPNFYTLRVEIFRMFLSVHVYLRLL